MGSGIDQETFDAGDYDRFQQRLTQCLSTLGRLLERPGFGVGPVTLGAELELFLVDVAARPLPLNQAVRAAAGDPRVNLELDRFNLELNATPTLLAGRPFTALEEELRLLLERVGDAAQGHGGRLALIGILPTLRRADLHPGALSDLPRYRALDRGLRRLRQAPFYIRIAGADPLELTSDDVAPEGATTSFQVHLRVDPAAFARTYNAVQAATAPVLAVAGNSPTFLGHRLWEETRIALCKQSLDERDRRGLRRRLARVAFGTGWLRGGATRSQTPPGQAGGADHACHVRPATACTTRSGSPPTADGQGTWASCRPPPAPARWPPGPRCRCARKRPDRPADAPGRRWRRPPGSRRRWRARVARRRRSAGQRGRCAAVAGRC